MKMRTLRTVDQLKRPEYQEFASIVDGVMYTHKHPQALGDEATIEGLKRMFGEDYIQWDMYEIVEIEYFESGAIGADIRNKLSSPKNLAALIEIFLTKPYDPTDTLLIPILKNEILQTKECVDYLSKIIK